jgi:hypothetical protein
MLNAEARPLRNLTLALALCLTGGSSLAANSPCAPSIGGRHEPAFVGSASEGLDFQTRCLVWEYSVQPKAELLPSPEAPSFGPRARSAQFVVTQPAPNRAPGSQSFSELLAQGLSLRPAGSEATLTAVPPASGAQPPAAK